MPSRSTLGLTALAFLGWTLFWVQVKQPAKVAVIDRVVEKLIEKEVLVDKVRTVVRIVTKPDGTREVEKSTETSSTTEKSKEVVRETTVTKPVLHDLPSYSIGAAVGRKAPLLPEPLYYSLEAGARLGSSPIWLTGQLSTKRDIAIGIRLEF